MRTNERVSTWRVLSLAVAAASSLAVSRVMGQNIVQNPSFEISGGTAVGGVAADWNCFNGDPNAVISLDTTNPHTGAQDLYMNNTDSGGYGLYMYQDTPAGSVTPGSTYTFNFYAAGATGNGGVGIYDIRWGGATGIIDDTGGQVYFPNSTTYSQYGNMKYTAPAGATYAEIAFTTATGAVTGSYSQIMIDDVSLTAPATSTTGVSQWNLAGAGQWDLGANWTNGYPNGIGAEADLLSSTTGTNGITANHSIYADVPITLGTLNFNNTNTYVVTGAGSLTMQNSTGAATVIVQAGTQKISLPLTFASNGNFNVSSGATLLVSNPLTIDPGVAVTTIGAGTVTYQAPITIGAGGSLSMSAPAIANALALIGNSTASATSASGHSLVQFDSLTLDTTSTYDLANNDMLIHGASLATVTGYLATGYNGGKWNGVGIASSAAASDTAHLTALGVIQATAPGTFEGAAVSTGDVLVKYTYYGDTNLDGKVDGSDYSKVDYGYLHQLGGWANGDFNYDGIVNGSDYTLIDNAFNQQSGVISDQLASATAQIASSSAVPEPGTLGIFSIGTAALLRRRRRIEA